mgnify:CR=1 FL=1|jgi:hypothetical protein
MVWKDLSESTSKIAQRVNASLTVVPREHLEPEDVPSSGPPTEGTLYLFGGDDGKNPLRDMWVYDLPSGEWDEPEFMGEFPTGRSRHTCTLVRHYRDESQKAEDRLYVFGGVGQHTEVLVYLDLARSKWVAPRTIGKEPPALLGHTAAQVGSALWLFGGRDTRRAYNTVWRMDTVSHEWVKPAPTGTQPPACSKHCMVVRGTRLLITLGEIALAQVAIYDTEKNAWLHAEVRA